MIVGSFEAKTHFSDLLVKAENGEEIVITRRGKPVAKIVSASPIPHDSAVDETWDTLRIIRKSIKDFSLSEAVSYRMEGRR